MKMQRARAFALATALTILAVTGAGCGTFRSLVPSFDPQTIWDEIERYNAQLEKVGEKNSVILEELAASIDKVTEARRTTQFLPVSAIQDSNALTGTTAERQALIDHLSELRTFRSQLSANGEKLDSELARVNQQLRGYLQAHQSVLWYASQHHIQRVLDLHERLSRQIATRIAELKEREADVAHSISLLRGQQQEPRLRRPRREPSVPEGRSPRVG